MFLPFSSFLFLFFFFFNDTATPEIYTLSLHDALPISDMPTGFSASPRHALVAGLRRSRDETQFTKVIAAIADRKSTRLNSSHQIISYAVFCLKKKKKKIKRPQ